jgi:hypothetical protein
LRNGSSSTTPQPWQARAKPNPGDVPPFGPLRLVALRPALRFASVRRVGKLAIRTPDSL